MVTKSTQKPHTEHGKLDAKQQESLPDSGGQIRNGLISIGSVSCRGYACSLAKPFAQVAVAIEAALKRNFHNRLVSLFEQANHLDRSAHGVLSLPIVGVNALLGRLRAIQRRDCYLHSLAGVR